MKISHRFNKRAFVVVGALMSVLATMSIPSHAADLTVEGISDMGADADSVKIWYRCNGNDCEYEAVLDQQLSDEVLEYRWEFSDGNSFTTTDPLASQTWANHGTKTATLIVYNIYCELFVGEAQFSIPDPLAIVVSENTDSESDQGDPSVSDPVGALPVENGTLESTIVRIGENSLRTVSEPLEGIDVSGDAFIFIDTLANAEKVAFELRNSASDILFSKVESTPPYDLAGGSAIEARPFDTGKLDDGSYVLSIAATYKDDSKEYLAVAFDIANSPEPSVESPQESEPTVVAALPDNTSEPLQTHSELVVSERTNRTASVPLSGAILEGNVYVSLSGAENAESVEFYMNDIGLVGNPIQIENNLPWDAFGGSKSRATPFRTRNMENGQYIISAKVIENGSSYVVHASFEVDN